MFSLRRCCLSRCSSGTAALSRSACSSNSNSSPAPTLPLWTARRSFLFGMRKRVTTRTEEQQITAQQVDPQRPHEDDRPQQCSATAATPERSQKSVPSPPMLREVSERLDTLKKDVIEALLDRKSIPAELLSAWKRNGVWRDQRHSCSQSAQFMHSMEEMARYYFARGGKLIRPTIALLMSAACNQARSLCSTPTEEGTQVPEIGLNQYRIAMVAEMIHNATLVHDDVIDESSTRRGLPTANARWGNKQAVLVGDFILARATKVLCSIGQPAVIETMAEIVEDLVKGELMQLNGPTNSTESGRFQHYMVKTFYKTGSLFANSCKSVAMLSGCDAHVEHLATEFGRNLGLAFQLVDDVLDYVASAAELGKPAANDLRLGLATCPVLFAAREHPELEALIERRFGTQGDVERALELVHRSRGLDQSRQLAREHLQKAIQCADELLPRGGRVRDCLVDIVRRQLDRER